MNRPEAIEDTAELVAAAGGRGIPVCVDHSVPEQVQQLVERIRAEQAGRLDVLVNDVWGGDALAEWGVPLWEHNLDNGLAAVPPGPRDPPDHQLVWRRGSWSRRTAGWWWR